IRRVETETSGEGTRVRAVSMWTDLADSVMKRTMAASGETTFGVTIMNQSSEEALQTVLSADWDAPSHFAAGNVAAAFAERKPVIEGTAITHLDAIRMICEQLGCEWEARLFEGIYYIDLVEEIGGGSHTTRPIDAPGEEGLANRLRMRITDDGENYYNRLIAFCGEREHPTTIANAQWHVADAVEDAGITSVYLEAPYPVAKNGLLNGLYLADEDGALIGAVADSAKP